MFDIIPVKDEKETLNIKTVKLRKRNLINNKFYHAIHKRAIVTSNQNIVSNTGTINIEADLLDYIILPSK